MSPVLAARGVDLERMGNRALGSMLRAGQLQRKERGAEAVVADGPSQSPAGRGSLNSSGGALAGQLSGGDRLDSQTRDWMESRFGESFDEVRIHTGSRAAQMADTQQARAFTVGGDIVFGEGQFAPQTTEGKRLLAHELAHVVQQRGTVGAVAGEQSAERDAHEAAHLVVIGGKPSVRQRAVAGMVQKHDQKLNDPFTNVHGKTVSVFERSMLIEAVLIGAMDMKIEKQGWENRGRRIFHIWVLQSNVNPMRWVKHPKADSNALSASLVVKITVEAFSGPMTVTIGDRAPAKPPSPQPQVPPAEPTEQPPSVQEQTETKPHSGDRISKVEQQSKNDPKGALKEAGELSKPELNSLGSEPRKSLLHAAADASSGSAALQIAHDLITTTPDRDAGPLADALQADGGKLLDDLKRKETDPAGASALDQASRDLEARRLDAPAPKGERDYVEWTPELQKKADEVREALKNFGSRKPDLNENMVGRPEWNTFKDKQKADLQRELRNLEREVKSWDSQLGPSGLLGGDAAAGIGAKAHEEVDKALQRVQAATTIAELMESRKLAKMALWRANQMMDAKRQLQRFEVGVQAWNKTQSGWASLASVPSHALAGVSSDRPDQIAANARADVNRGLDLLRDAKTPEDMSRAATQLKQAMANADHALSAHQDEVYEGAEKTIVGIKVVAVTSAAIVAPEFVIPGMILGGGLGYAGQRAQIADGLRTEVSGMEVFDSSVVGGFAGGILGPLTPLAAGGSGWAATAGTLSTGVFTGFGLSKAADEFYQGHGWSGAFDIGMAALPFVVKGVSSKGPEIGRWVRTRSGALMFRTSVAIENAGLSGSQPTVSIPYKPGIAMVVDTAGRPLGTINPRTGGFVPLSAPEVTATPGEAQGNWLTWKPTPLTPPHFKLPSLRLQQTTAATQKSAPSGQLSLFDLGLPMTAPAVAAAPNATPTLGYNDPAFAPRYSEGDLVDTLRVPRQLSLYDILPAQRGGNKPTSPAAKAKWNRLMKFIFQISPKPNSVLEINGNQYHFDNQARLVKVTSDKNMAAFNRYVVESSKDERIPMAYGGAPKAPGYDFGHLGGLKTFGSNDFYLQERGGYLQERALNQSGAWSVAESAVRSKAYELQLQGKPFQKVAEVGEFVDNVPTKWRIYLESEGRVVAGSREWITQSPPPK